ncbi:MAG: tRNA threonylcarbamoyladenosine dehydratase [Clostridiaceae bacterium]|nr:tRNA threonylcarbamoyladenosine dehydratase [Clostridiaceae bacterium]
MSGKNYGWLDRTRILIGDQAIQTLKNKSVAIFGIGGVGSYAAEALARSGVGTIHLIDKDIVDITNINRQLLALHSTVGKLKTEVMKARILDINPDAKVITYPIFFEKNNKDAFDFCKVDYVVDAIDTIDSKVFLICEAHRHGVPIISAMGAGNKLDPTRFHIDDLSRTGVCPLAKIMRRRLKEHGIENIDVVYSREVPRQIERIEHSTADSDFPAYNVKRAVGSVSFVPSVVGLMMAGHVVNQFLDVLNHNQMSQSHSD